MTVASWWRRLRHFARRDSMSEELREEMRLHMELRAAQLASVGTSDEDARYAAHCQFGNQTLIAEEGRNMSGFAWVEHGMQDLHLAVRRIRRQPAFAAAVIGVMALGIGATTAMFSAVDAAMLRPLPFVRPSELVWLRDIRVPFDPGTGVSDGAVHMLDVNDVARISDLFSASATYAAGGLNVSDDDRPIRAKAGVVTVGFFSTLGAVPERGRLFSAEEGKPGAAPVTIISHKLWQNQFGGRDIGSLSLSLNGKAHRVIGVMPDGFSFPRESDLWIPMSNPTTFATFSAFRGFLPSETIARLAPGVTVDRAQLQLRDRWQRSLSPDKPVPSDDNAKEELEDIRTKGALTPFQEQLVGDKGTALLMLLGATALLLIIACANVTNLLLSQASVRRREMALREVLGATRRRLARQLLVESVLLALAGALVGVAIAPAALQVVGRLSPPVLADIAPARVDMRVLAFAVALALVTGVVFGLWPALGGSKESLEGVIKTGANYGSTSGSLGRGRRLLVATELALTVMLLIGAGLLQRSFSHVMGLDRGMSTDRVASLEIAMPSAPLAVSVKRINDMVAAIGSTPGIAAAGAVNDLPLRGGGGMLLSINTRGSGKNMTMARYLIATSGYFDALGIRLLDGRQFSATDDSLSPKVALVSASMAKAFWPDRNAVGATFDMMGKPITVIGVVSDVREATLESDPRPQMYFAMSQQNAGNLALVARGTLSPNALLAALTSAVRQTDRTQAVYNVRMMDDVVDASVKPRRTNMLLISIFAGVALVLSALGVYAVVSYGVAQRTRELGIRSALGARAANLVSLVAGELLWVSLAGVGAGLAAAWAASRFVSSMLYSVSPHDPVTYLLVPLGLLLPAAVAAIIPAYRAAQVDPTVILRAD